MPEDAQLPWFRFEPDRWLHDLELDRLEPEAFATFFRFLLLCHNRWPIDRWWIVRQSDLRSLGKGRLYRGKRRLDAVAATGILEAFPDGLGLPERWRLSGAPSTERTRRYRDRARPPSARVTPGVCPPSAQTLVEPIEDSEIGNIAYTEKKTVLEDCSDLGSLESYPTTPPSASAGSPPSGVVAAGNPAPEQDEFDEFTTQQFVLTPQSGNGNWANRDSGVSALFAFWQSLPHVIHHRSIEPYKSAIESLISRYGYNQARMALQRWSELSGDRERYWTPQPAWSLREVITRHKGEYVERLLSDDYRRLFAHRGAAARPSLDAHYAALLKRAGNA